MNPGSTDSVLVAAYWAEAILLAAVSVASARQRRHAPLATWLALSLGYALLNERWITPWLGGLPRPFHGTARIVMHVGQALYLGVLTGVVVVVWRAFRVPSRWFPLPFFVAVCSMITLVDGYTHAPAPGLYRIGGVVFRSNTVFVATSVVVYMLGLAVLLPRFVRALLEPTDKHDTVLSLATIILFIPGLLHVGIPYVWDDTAAARAYAAVLLLACLLCIGLYAALMSESVQKNWQHVIEDRLALARRARAMARIHPRLERARTRRAQRGIERVAETDAPYAMELSTRVGRVDEVSRLGLIDEDAVEAFELVAAVTGAMRDADALRVIASAVATLRSSADLGPDWPVRWEALIQKGEIQRLPILAPITLMLLSAVQGIPASKALAALELAQSLHGEFQARIAPQRVVTVA